MTKSWMTSFSQVEEAVQLIGLRPDLVILVQVPVFQDNRLLYMYQVRMDQSTACISRIV
jgi:hypothetical protein